MLASTQDQPQDGGRDCEKRHRPDMRPRDRCRSLLSYYQEDRSRRRAEGEQDHQELVLELAELLGLVEGDRSEEIACH